MLSVDGTDCPFEAQGKAFYSHKFKGTGLRYEVGVGIKGGDICWIQGPLPCGLYPDIKICRLALIHELDADERIEADLGYRGDAPEYVKVAGPLYTEEDYKAMKKRVASRHETVNKRLKQWKCLDSRFRHSVAHHSACFRAVAVVTQLAIEHGEPLFEVEYEDDLDL